MIRRCKPSGVANATLKPLWYRGSFSYPRLRFNPTLDAFAPTPRPRVASHFCFYESVSQLKPVGQFPHCRHASSNALDSHGGLNRTALYELHTRKGGKMVPFAGYSMPVQYSDLGVGESHKWTREKASLFDVGHM